jgi:hypothetical protein
LTNELGQPKSYTIQDIFKVHATARLNMYKARKQHLIESLEHHREEWGFKTKFLKCLLDDTLQVRKRFMADIKTDMTELGFPEPTHTDLLKLPLSVQSQEKVDEWTNKMATIETDLAHIRDMSISTFWRKDLAVLKKAVKKQNADLVEHSK